MKRIFIVLLFSFAAPLAFAATASNDLQPIERRWGEAMVHHDQKFLGEVMLPDFVFTDESGHALNKAQFTNMFVSGAVKFRSVSVSQMRVRVYGNSAVVTGRMDAKGRANGQDISGAYRFTDTFVRWKGRWVGVASHASRVS